MMAKLKNSLGLQVEADDNIVLKKKRKSKQKKKSVKIDLNELDQTDLIGHLYK